MKYTFCSVFAPEMKAHISLLSSAGSAAKNQSALTSFDKFLVSIGFSARSIAENIISDWLYTINGTAKTKCNYLSEIKRFAKYMSSIGVHFELPESPKLDSVYVPYIFSQDELRRIFSVADDFRILRQLTRSAILFPFLLRILLGCGLRLGEGLSLKWQNIDLEIGVITIRDAKNLKERFVPISASLADTLNNLRSYVLNSDICADYLFESSVNARTHYRNNTFYTWFQSVLRESGIVYAKSSRTERGPCPHCLRHTFVHLSYLKSEQEGRRFEDTAPFLAAYLGHDSPRETEAYLTSNHSIYTESHKRVESAIGNLFPEVLFDEI
jgi:integrase